MSIREILGLFDWSTRSNISLVEPSVEATSLARLLLDGDDEILTEAWTDLDLEVKAGVCREIQRRRTVALKLS